MQVYQDNVTFQRISGCIHLCRIVHSFWIFSNMAYTYRPFMQTGFSGDNFSEQEEFLTRYIEHLLSIYFYAFHRYFGFAILQNFRIFFFFQFFRVISWLLQNSHTCIYRSFIISALFGIEPPAFKDYLIAGYKILLPRMNSILHYKNSSSYSHN